MNERAQRRLTTIVAADIAGFSRLVGTDEEGTLTVQRRYRAELIEPMLTKYHGRIANTAGDSFLLEFPSAVEAVRFAVAVQEGMSERNPDFPVDRRIEYRIGVNVGDVMADGDDLLGDGVNIAARLEGLAEPGGICISRTTRDQVRDRMEIGLRDMGEVEVKNLARPVRAFQVIIGADETDGTMGQIPNPLHKPPMAVMPLENMSHDPEQAFFADGITEDIITALSRLRWLFVIDQNTSFSYKGQTYDTAQVGRALGIRYVLEGSVRQAGGRADQGNGPNRRRP